VERDLQAASEGVGPLLQRDYWAVFDECRYAPSQLITHLREHFCELPPEALVKFTPRSGMSLGSELDIAIVPAHRACVRMVHDDAQSFTLATLEGHPEAGRITFGAYRNPKGDVIFHIRSRARSSSTPGYPGFLAIGDAMQTNTWTDFITTAAPAAGARVRGVIHASTVQVEPNPDDDHPLDTPTFQAVGD
jgi:hypothetical protein